MGGQGARSMPRVRPYLGRQQLVARGLNLRLCSRRSYLGLLLCRRRHCRTLHVHLTGRVGLGKLRLQPLRTLTSIRRSSFSGCRAVTQLSRLLLRCLARRCRLRLHGACSSHRRVTLSLRVFSATSLRSVARVCGRGGGRSCKWHRMASGASCSDGGRPVDCGATPQHRTATHAARHHCAPASSHVQRASLPVPPCA